MRSVFSDGISCQPSFQTAHRCPSTPLKSSAHHRISIRAVNDAANLSCIPSHSPHACHATMATDRSAWRCNFPPRPRRLVLSQRLGQRGQDRGAMACAGGDGEANLGLPDPSGGVGGMSSPPVIPCIILVEPIMGENIGAVARSMKNFGLSDLRLVSPKVSAGGHMCGGPHVPACPFKLKPYHSMCLVSIPSHLIVLSCIQPLTTNHQSPLGQLLCIQPLTTNHQPPTAIMTAVVHPTTTYQPLTTIMTAVVHPTTNYEPPGWLAQPAGGHRRLQCAGRDSLGTAVCHPGRSPGRPHLRLRSHCQDQQVEWNALRVRHTRVHLYTCTHVHLYTCTSCISRPLHFLPGLGGLLLSIGPHLCSLPASPLNVPSPNATQVHEQGLHPQPRTRGGPAPAGGVFFRRIRGGNLC